ncbi:MAG TPA: hypothetical protein VFG63_00690, partial [Nocardioidaceae bacterium]|nr:hypothetical protein [Nocardioidaceae bacterium]
MTAKRRRPARVPISLAGHRWVGAALVELGRGENSPRAERAARTGRYVVSAGTRIDVLEVYCADCRVPYGNGFSEPCPRRLAEACAG